MVRFLKVGINPVVCNNSERLLNPRERNASLTDSLNGTKRCLLSYKVVDSPMDLHSGKKEFSGGGKKWEKPHPFPIVTSLQFS